MRAAASRASSAACTAARTRCSAPTRTWVAELPHLNTDRATIADQRAQIAALQRAAATRRAERPRRRPRSPGCSCRPTGAVTASCPPTSSPSARPAASTGPSSSTPVARDGVRVDQTVISGPNLVGRIVRVSASSATVLLAADPDSGVGVRDQRSKQVGIAAGRGLAGYAFTGLNPVRLAQGRRRAGHRPGGQDHLRRRADRRHGHRDPLPAGRDGRGHRARRRSSRRRSTWSGWCSSAALRAAPPGPDPVDPPVGRRGEGATERQRTAMTIVRCAAGLAAVVSAMLVQATVVGPLAYPVPVSLPLLVVVGVAVLSGPVHRHRPRLRCRPARRPHLAPPGRAAGADVDGRGHRGRRRRRAGPRPGPRTIDPAADRRASDRARFGQRSRRRLRREMSRWRAQGLLTGLIAVAATGFAMLALDVIGAAEHQRGRPGRARRARCCSSRPG